MKFSNIIRFCAGLLTILACVANIVKGVNPQIAYVCAAIWFVDAELIDIKEKMDK